MSIFSSLRAALGDPKDFDNVWLALIFLPFGFFFDAFDGKVARWRKKSSLMGQELDSLADLVRSYAFFVPISSPNLKTRSHSVSPPLWSPSPLVSDPSSTLSVLPSSFFAVSHVSLASTSLSPSCPRMRLARASTSRELLFPLRSAWMLSWPTGYLSAGFTTTFPLVSGSRAPLSSSTLRFFCS